MPSTPDKRPAKRPGDVAKTTRSAFHTLSMTSVGLELGVAVILGLFVGRWLDGQLGTEPWMMILWVVLGFTAGFKGVFRAMRESDRAAEENAS